MKLHKHVLSRFISTPTVNYNSATFIKAAVGNDFTLGIPLDQILSIDWGDGSHLIEATHNYANTEEHTIEVILQTDTFAQGYSFWETRPVKSAIIHADIIDMQTPVFAGIIYSYTETVELHLETTTNIGYSGLDNINCDRFDLYLYSDTIVTYENTIFPGNIEHYIFVPPELLATYKNDSYWSTMANIIYPIGSQPSHSGYLTFTAPTAFSVAARDNYVGTNYTISSNRTMEYSMDTITWSSWDGQPISVSPGNEVYIRGTITADGRDTLFTNFTFPTGTSISCTGDIRSLDDYTNPENVILKRYCYKSMFRFCDSLIRAPDLPATTLSYDCYYYMFSECTSLVNPPSLPATILEYGCYYSMFYSCTSLTQTPDLPATILKDYCYANMFNNCSSLVNAPELPATTLARACYNSMFYSCSSLVNPPLLPATTLEESCYSNMFTDCISLVQPSALPATTLARACYDSMFRNCSSLTQPPSLPATILEYGCYAGMFSSCSSLTQTPSLPATILEYGCYYSMFYSCTSLTQTPDLPATILKDYCYARMFINCTKIKISETQTGTYQNAWRIPTNGTGSEATNWNTNTLNSTGGTFTSDPSINTTYYYSLT